MGFPPAETGQSPWGRAGGGYQRRGCSGDRRNMAKGQKPGLVSPPDGVTPLSPRSGSDIPFRNVQPSPQSQDLAASQHELGSLAQCPRPPVQLCPLPSMGTPPAGSPEAPPSSVLATPPSQQLLRPLPSQAAPPVSWQGLSLCSAPVWGDSGERRASLQLTAPPALTMNPGSRGRGASLPTPSSSCFSLWLRLCTVLPFARLKKPEHLSQSLSCPYSEGRPQTLPQLTASH